MPMLDNLFGSKARVKVLNVFLLNPDKQYYLRQLARDLGLQVNSVRRELKNLEDFGLLISPQEHYNTDVTSESNRHAPQDKKYYQVNKNFVLFGEIRSLILKSQLLMGKSLVDELKKICEPKLLLLTGSFVGDVDLPTDILVVAKVSKTRFSEMIKKLEQDLGREMNYTLLDEREFKYRQEIADVFLHQILESKKMVLINEFDFLF